MDSSANLTRKGTKNVSSRGVELEIKAAADIIIDHGRRNYSIPRPSSTMFDFKKVQQRRFGACNGVITDHFK
jgi:hypothetical protein